MKTRYSLHLAFLISLITGIASLASCTLAEAADKNNGEAAFVYREIYLPESTGENAHKIGLNTLDNDWALWGHNLADILPEKKSESIYAKKNGSTVHNQFCFTSERLFEYISDYIDNHYDSTDSVRFAILPNDNDIVCLCEDCVAIGNKAKDASPAVFDLINKLAKKFPNHVFFTSYYRTTRGLPKTKLPHNVGVLVSAMDYPLAPTETPAETEFMKILSQWNQKTDRIFVWDYINNFDDYFTPFPVFDIMQRRLNLYKQNGVTAVFLNGSGTDFSSFSGLKADVLAELTGNPQIDWKSVLKEKAAERFPKAGNIIADFIIAQEEFVKQNGKQLPLYDGVGKALQTYLPQEQFIKFHDELRSVAPSTSGEEKQYVDQLLGALALTRLELNRINGTTEGSRELLNELKTLNGFDIPAYSESGWSVDNYASDYDHLLSHSEANGNKNLLKGVKLMPMTALDPDYSDITIVTDGLLGIPSNYHSGNLIMSPDTSTKIAIPRNQDIKRLRVCLSYNPAYRIGLPSEVVLESGGMQIGRVQPSYPSDESGHVMVDFNVPKEATGSLLLTLVRDPEIHSMAIDEIEGFEK